ncbi:hypothetical protein GCM10010377_52580 [Streptomyces viridiviolaceus]|uniref:Phage L5-like integrase N-terminal domain-containing protein n=1 Tax=Streptomyces viridiviolaceus TaxID=68282 RepID=A0ABW2E8J9_9ACTN|nr:hypothetical protein GCM10010377_52580 [Streptomyces viridiviolaceus]
MASKKGRRRRFGAVRQYRPGRWTASYLGPDGERIRAEETFATRKDAEIWLSQVEADLSGELMVRLWCGTRSPVWPPGR